MTPGRRGIPAKQAARDFGASLTSYLVEALALVSELEHDQDKFSERDRCFETCAALWATIVISMEASALLGEERETLLPLVFAALEPMWAKHCGTEKAAFGRLRTRADAYLALRSPRSHVATATAIVQHLLHTLGAPEKENHLRAQRLAALLAHRMLGDIYRLNELKMQVGIQLSLVALLLTSHLASGGETLLRAMRLI
jgi:hypothetical protein